MCRILIAQGASAGSVAKVLSGDPRKAAGLQPLLVALQQHADEAVRAPVEVMEMAADILKIMKQQGTTVNRVTQ